MFLGVCSVALHCLLSKTPQIPCRGWLPTICTIWKSQSVKNLEPTATSWASGSNLTFLGVLAWECIQASFHGVLRACDFFSLPLHRWRTLISIWKNKYGYEHISFLILNENEETALNIWDRSQQNIRPTSTPTKTPPHPKRTVKMAGVRFRSCAKPITAPARKCSLLPIQSPKVKNPPKS